MTTGDDVGEPLVTQGSCAPESNQRRSRRRTHGAHTMNRSADRRGVTMGNTFTRAVGLLHDAQMLPPAHFADIVAGNSSIRGRHECRPSRLPVYRMTVDARAAASVVAATPAPR
jgi:hypothetical protein